MIIDYFSASSFTIYQFICINNKNLNFLKDEKKKSKKPVLKHKKSS